MPPKALFAFSFGLQSLGERQKRKTLMARSAWEWYLKIKLLSVLLEPNATLKIPPFFLSRFHLVSMLIEKRVIMPNIWFQVLHIKLDPLLI